MPRLSTKSFLIILIMLICIDVHEKIYASEVLARQAEESGDRRQAITHYISALQTYPQGSPKDEELRGKVIDIVRKLEFPPAIPENARRHIIRAQMMLENADSDRDYVKAFTEFKSALRIAPWWAEAYFNYGIAQEAYGDYSGSIWSFSMFLVAAPNDPDARKVQNKIYSLEVQLEKEIAESIGVVESIQKEWGFVVIRLNRQRSFEIPIEVWTKDETGVKQKMTIEKVSGNKASAIPSGTLKGISIGNSVYLRD